MKKFLLAIAIASSLFLSLLGTGKAIGACAFLCNDGKGNGTFGANLTVTGVLTAGSFAFSTPASAGAILRSNGTSWLASTATYPDTISTGQLLRASGANVISASTSTYPDTISSGQLLRASGANVIAASTSTYPDTISSGQILRASGANVIAASTATYPNTVTANAVLYGTGTNAIGESASLTFNGTTLTANTATVSTGALTVTGGTVTTGAATALSLATTGGTQVQVTNTASSTRNLTLTGSNGASPTISTTDGNLTITSGATNGYVIITPTGASGFARITGSGLILDSTFTASALTAASGTPSSICQNTATKEVTVNAALTCTVSSERYKDDIRPFNGNGLKIVTAMKPDSFYYKDRLDRPRLGLVAEDLAAIDPRLSEWDESGRPNSIDFPAIMAVLVKAVQEQQGQITEMRSEIERLKARTTFGALQ